MLIFPSYRVISLKWLITNIVVEQNQAFSKSKDLLIEIFCIKINLQDLNNKTKTVMDKIKDKGTPKLWASSKTILWEWFASTILYGIFKLLLLWRFKKEKVDGPHPNKGLSWILENVDCQISNLGELNELNSLIFKKIDSGKRVLKIDIFLSSKNSKNLIDVIKVIKEPRIIRILLKL